MTSEDPQPLHASRNLLKAPNSNKNGIGSGRLPLMMATLLSVATFAFLKFQQHQNQSSRQAQSAPQERSSVRLSEGLFQNSTRLVSGMLTWTVVGQNLVNCEEVICQMPYRKNMILEVSRLIPEYRYSLSMGTLALGLRTREVEEAIELYDRAQALFPMDWRLPFRAFYHFQFDQNDPETAKAFMTRAYELGAPSWTKSISNLSADQAAKGIRRSLDKNESSLLDEAQ